MKNAQNEQMAVHYFNRFAVLKLETIPMLRTTSLFSTHTESTCPKCVGQSRPMLVSVSRRLQHNIQSLFGGTEFKKHCKVTVTSVEASQIKTRSGIEYSR